MTIVQKSLLIVSGFLVGSMMTIAMMAMSSKTATDTYALEDFRSYMDAFEIIRKNYVEPIGDDKLFTDSIAGMVSGLDPHSNYLDAEAVKELQVQTEGKFGGLGIEVTMDEDGYVKVISPIEGTPADNAGIRARDVIVKIDDLSVRGMKFIEAINKMRGKPKTKVNLTISRKAGGDAQQIFTITLIRDIINVVSVKSKMVEPGYGYLRISQFQETTMEMMVDQLNKLHRQAPLKGLILDLRNDPGGILNAAIGVSAAFLEEGLVVVSTDGRIPEAKEVERADPRDYLSNPMAPDPLAKLSPVFKQIPIVVLINGGSASASEIVAGALQDHKRALVMGTKSFGKGSVQRAFPLGKDKAIKLTIALYFTPNKRSIQAEGIVPDRIVEDPLNPERRIRESDLQHHLDGPSKATSKTGDKKADETKASEEEKGFRPGDNIICRPVNKEGRVREGFKFGDDDDYQMQQALLALKDSKSFDAKGRPIITEAMKQAAEKEKKDRQDKRKDKK